MTTQAPLEPAAPQPMAMGLGNAIARAHGEPDGSALAQWAALLYAHLQAGRVYLDLRQPLAGLEEAGPLPPPLDPAPAWVAVVGPGQAAPGTAPLVRCADRLWLARYHDFDCRLRDLLNARRNRPPRPMNEVRLRADIARLFPGRPVTEKDRGQMLAAAALVDLHFGLLTGGPGTGKTTSLAKMLLLHLRQAQPDQMAPILLLAPTGKAATRIRQSLSRTSRPEDPSARSALGDTAMDKLCQGLRESPDLLALLDRLDPQSPATLVKTQTIHKALGPRAERRDGQGPFRHDPDHPLRASFVIVDEVSMVDLALMARLVAAVPPEAPLVLVGDAEQLQSVEAGPVLADIARELSAIPADRADLLGARTGCRAVELGPDLCRMDHVRLSYNHRFHAGTRIGRLAAHVNAGQADECVQLLEHTGSDAAWIKLPEDGRGLPAGAKALMIEPAAYGRLHELLQNAELPAPAAAVAAFDQFRVLCAMRKGPDGVDQWNARLQQWVVGPAHAGRPRAVMVAVNDPASGLCNGDTGLVLPAADGSATFHSSDGSLTWPAALLPQNEPGWAITIHKSQGSEYDTVAIALPRAGGQPLLTRRLLYTALTRARRRVIILATESALRKAISTP